jgi:hypothetical protein
MSRRYTEHRVTDDPFELGWAAGFLEGEGSFHLSKSVRISAGQQSIEPLVRLQRALGCGRIRAAGTPGRGAHKAHWSKTWSWTLGGVLAAEVMRVLEPHMSARRREQIRVCLDFMDERFAERACLVCGEHFTPRNTRKVYCSRRCNRTAHARRHGVPERNSTEDLSRRRESARALYARRQTRP